MTAYFRGCVIALSLFIVTPEVAFAQGNGQGNAGNGIQQRLAAIEAAIAQLQAALASESGARAVADTTLQTNMGLEAAARQTADTVLQSNIDGEAVARAAADTTLQANISAETQARLLANGEVAGDIFDLASDVTALAGAGALVPQSLLDLAPYISVNQATLNGVTGPHVIFTGANVHIRNGSGLTSGWVPNGRGNLIVGYNETSGHDADRGGSHNLVIGMFHRYSSWGGFVAGFENSITEGYATVSGGRANTASGAGSVVSGGSHNTASGGFYSAVSGGFNNTASGPHSTVSGGQGNTAFGQFSTVSGGVATTAIGDSSHVP